ncbi:hypothetical protein AQUSIP_12780 [Aquicella siphonis]|uniref:Uncharacterized protein n=1 Tax=Aquicella siphonis TaxID=254247 RepID=A0A5E4PHP9_9COXI|nr:hypothetical protein AQUSIP_12780 [Aquicella siphonis]
MKMYDLITALIIIIIWAFTLGICFSILLFSFLYIFSV